MNEITPSDIALLYDWTPAQRDALEAVSRTFEQDWLERIQETEGIGRMISENIGENTVGVLTRRIKNILDKNRYIDKFRSSLPNILCNLLEGKVVLVDIPRMSDRSELFLLSVLSRYVLDAYKEDSKPQRKNCLITIEEAQRVMGSGSNTARFETIAREGRKFGVGLCAITQQPKLIDKQLLSQFNTLVVMGLGDRNDRSRLEESAKRICLHWILRSRPLNQGKQSLAPLTYHSLCLPGYIGMKITCEGLKKKIVQMKTL
jgi:DNA helicase HerA-like ATPase